MPKRFFTEEHKAFMREMIPGRTRKELAALFNEHFGLSLSNSRIFDALVRYKIYTNSKFHFSDEHLAFIQRNLPGRSYAETAELLNARLGTNVTAVQVRNAAGWRGWRNGRDTRFQDGHQGYQTTSRFQKGHVPARKFPTGTEHVELCGYTSVKVAHNKWRRKLISVWESIHGPIPPGHTVVFGDGNKRNFNPDNLVLLSRRTFSFMNHHNLIGGSAELTRTGKTIAELRLTINDRQKESCK